MNKILDSDASRAVQVIVRSMPDDTPSMAWRSSLNERLLSLGPVKKRLSAFGIALRAGVGATALAAIFVAVLLIHKGNGSTHEAERADGKALAASLISEYHESVDSSEIAGSGVSVGEQERGSSAEDDNLDTDSDTL